MSGHSCATDILQEMYAMRRKGCMGPLVDDAVRRRQNHAWRHQNAGTFNHPSVAVDIDVPDRVPRRSVAHNCYSIIIANNARLKLLTCGGSEETDQATDGNDWMSQHDLARDRIALFPSSGPGSR